MTTIRPGTLGLLKARQREARGGGAGGGDRLIAADGVQFPDGVRQEQEEPGPGARDVSKRFKERLRGESISRQAAQGQQVEEEEIGRDLPGVGEALDPTSSPGALSARFDAGVFFHYPIMEAISRETVTQDVVRSDDLAVAAANTQGTLAFSIQEDHYLQNLSLDVVSNAGNIAVVSLMLQPFGDPDIQPLIAEAAPQTAQYITPTGSEFFVRFQDVVVPDLPLFIRRETDYVLGLETDAGGAATVAAQVLITRAPDGARIPR